MISFFLAELPMPKRFFGAPFIKAAKKIQEKFTGILALSY